MQFGYVVPALFMEPDLSPARHSFISQVVGRRKGSSSVANHRACQLHRFWRALAERGVHMCIYIDGERSRKLKKRRRKPICQASCSDTSRQHVIYYEGTALRSDEKCSGKQKLAFGPVCVGENEFPQRAFAACLYTVLLRPR